MFDFLDNAKTAHNPLTRPPDWLHDVQTAVEKEVEQAPKVLRQNGTPLCLHGCNVSSSLL